MLVLSVTRSVLEGLMIALNSKHFATQHASFFHLKEPAEKSFSFDLKVIRGIWILHRSKVN